MIDVVWLVNGALFDSGVIVGGLITWISIDWIYRRLGRPWQ